MGDDGDVCAICCTKSDPEKMSMCNKCELQYCTDGIDTHTHTHTHTHMASPAKHGKQRGAALSAPIVEEVEEARAAMSQQAAGSSATPIKATEQKQLALRFAWDRRDVVFQSVSRLDT